MPAPVLRMPPAAAPLVIRAEIVRSLLLLPLATLNVRVPLSLK